MNILHLKYAVETAKAGSLNKAAEALYMNQPNLSRAIKELESSLGITLFIRSARGMVPTPEGEEFLNYARQILRQIDEVEALYKGAMPARQRFSISVPRASYIAEAFTRFSRTLTKDHAEIYYQETNAMRAVQNILCEDYKLGVVRYRIAFDRYFKEMLEEKGFAYELVAEFTCALVMSRRHPLAAKENLSPADLAPYVEIAHADHYVPSLPQTEVKKEELADNIARRIFVYERASQLSLLSDNPETFMWVSPIPQALLDRCGLVQRACPEAGRVYRDVLIHRRDYRLTELDQAFLTQLCAVRRECMPD